MCEGIINNPIYIKYLIIGDIDNYKLITEYSSTVVDIKDKKHANQIFQKLCKSNERRFEERNIISGKTNKFYFSLFQPNIAFVAYADLIYPDNMIFEMFDEIRKEKILGMINEETKELDPNGRQSLKQIIEKYQEKDKIGDISEVQKSINKVRIESKDNKGGTLIQNEQGSENLEINSEQITNVNEEFFNSNGFKKENLFLKSKLRMTIIFIVLIIFIIILCAVL